MVVIVRKRIAIFLVGLLAVILVLTGRIAWIQFVEGKQLAGKIREQLTDIKPLQSPRGTIYDRNGKELAVSRLDKSLYVNHGELNIDADTLAGMLAPILDMKYQDVVERLKRGGSFVWLKRTLEQDSAQKVMALIKAHNIKGLDFIDESKRYYPNDSLAAQLLGFVGTDDVGLEGLEMVLDKLIKGAQLSQSVETDNQGIPIFKSIFSFTAHKERKSVYLTIDTGIQFVVEQNLDKVIKKTHAKAATIIIMNPRTGEGSGHG